MEKDWPTSFNFTEKDLDTHFIGHLSLEHIDDYGQIKAGSTSVTTTVRSIVDTEGGIIKLIAHIPTRHGVDKLVMDGSTGLYGTITERMAYINGDMIKIDALYIKLLTANEMREATQKTIDGYTVWRTSLEFDDIIFNQDKQYSYLLYYFAKNKKLIGIYAEIPIRHFNHYVHMRDLWFREYKGAKKIHTV